VAYGRERMNAFTEYISRKSSRWIGVESKSTNEYMNTNTSGGDATPE